ncbi:ankyrin-repeat protein, putative [Plasmodium knowlesi strain H]|uniref:Ankyrin-repeat protein, putative n=3 Tax=Plasmodium knowlesi TaxID=5850 RepID=A0A5K1V8C2_PLAKH|nr:PHAX domain-containing protein, putative [Plasmodium knowlesi strain H]OTN68229.1 putative Ankyrin-repeat protein [Plasmodium knowlesi]CAA9987112.1 PHAX domain-containing protein, putative [Plasmodium knowlesi strain H]SBO23857.1 ankyrin-repeat protein, putative [Plasmodium knowlesi strain H]SBO25668.1 ankyrin-repeat protein, putative [Plasmodium knowlesi strain H]VVS76586.1 PHAX domain-containing protein, putative [Plasmodium knowlesi strain H]|eukprot:XP_002261734.1 ankyrin-repeat protein, putative [Plasmodium knowlesi strain H]
MKHLPYHFTVSIFKHLLCFPPEKKMEISNEAQKCIGVMEAGKGSNEKEGCKDSLCGKPNSDSNVVESKAVEGAGNNTGNCNNSETPKISEGTSGQNQSDMNKTVKGKKRKNSKKKYYSKNKTQADLCSSEKTSIQENGLPRNSSNLGEEKTKGEEGTIKSDVKNASNVESIEKGDGEQTGNGNGIKGYTNAQEVETSNVKEDEAGLNKTPDGERKTKKKRKKAKRKKKKGKGAGEDEDICKGHGKGDDKGDDKGHGEAGDEEISGLTKIKDTLQNDHSNENASTTTAISTNTDCNTRRKSVVKNTIDSANLYSNNLTTDPVVDNKQSKKKKKKKKKKSSKGNQNAQHGEAKNGEEIFSKKTSINHEAVYKIPSKNMTRDELNNRTNLIYKNSIGYGFPPKSVGSNFSSNPCEASCSNAPLNFMNMQTKRNMVQLSKNTNCKYGFNVDNQVYSNCMYGPVPFRNSNECYDFSYEDGVPNGLGNFFYGNHMSRNALMERTLSLHGMYNVGRASALADVGAVDRISGVNALGMVDSADGFGSFSGAMFRRQRKLPPRGNGNLAQGANYELGLKKADVPNGHMTRFNSVAPSARHLLYEQNQENLTFSERDSKKKGHYHNGDRSMSRGGQVLHGGVNNTMTVAKMANIGTAVKEENFSSASNLGYFTNGANLNIRGEHPQEGKIQLSNRPVIPGMRNDGIYGPLQRGKYDAYSPHPNVEMMKNRKFTKDMNAPFHPFKMQNNVTNSRRVALNGGGRENNIGEKSAQGVVAAKDKEEIPKLTDPTTCERGRSTNFEVNKEIHKFIDYCVKNYGDKYIANVLHEFAPKEIGEKYDELKNIFKMNISEENLSHLQILEKEGSGELCTFLKDHTEVGGEAEVEHVESLKGESQKDELLKGESPKEELLKEELLKEELPKEELLKEELPKEELLKEESPKKELHKEEPLEKELLKEGAPAGGATDAGNVFEGGPSLSVTIPPGLSLPDINRALLHGAYLDNIAVVKKCLEKNADINYFDKIGRRALHYACAGGYYEICKLLIDNGAKVNVSDYKHWTPLHIAVTKMHKEITELLLKNDANIHAMLPHSLSPNRGKTTASMCIHFAAIKGNKEITELLLQYGAKINDTDLSNRTVLHYAAYRNNSDYLKFLIYEKKAKVNIFDVHNRLPIHSACLGGVLKNVQLLAENKSFLQKKDIYNMTPMDIATIKKFKNIRKFLVKYINENFSPNDAEEAEEKKNIAQVEVKNEGEDSKNTTDVIPHEEEGEEEEQKMDPKEFYNDNKMIKDILTTTISTILKERNRDQIKRVVDSLGVYISLSLLEKTILIQNYGGIDMVSKEGKRTNGGVFFYLIKYMYKNDIISKFKYDYIVEEEKEKKKTYRKLKKKLLQEEENAKGRTVKDIDGGVSGEVALEGKNSNKRNNKIMGQSKDIPNGGASFNNVKGAVLQSVQNGRAAVVDVNGNKPSTGFKTQKTTRGKSSLSTHKGEVHHTCSEQVVQLSPMATVGTSTQYNFNALVAENARNNTHFSNPQNDAPVKDPHMSNGEQGKKKKKTKKKNNNIIINNDNNTNNTGQVVGVDTQAGTLNNCVTKVDVGSSFINLLQNTYGDMQNMVEAQDQRKRAYHLNGVACEQGNFDWGHGGRYNSFDGFGSFGRLDQWNSVMSLNCRPPRRNQVNMNFRNGNNQVSMNFRNGNNLVSMNFRNNGNQYSNSKSIRSYQNEYPIPYVNGVQNSTYDYTGCAQNPGVYRHNQNVYMVNNFCAPHVNGKQKMLSSNMSGGRFRGYPKM